MPSATVRRKLFFAIFGPSVGVLLLAGGFGLWLDAYSLRRSIEEEATIQSSLLALAIRSPLSLEDRFALQETVDSLKANPHIVFGGVYSSETNLVVSYSADRLFQPPPVPVAYHDADSFSVVKSITVGDETIGYLFMEISLKEYNTRLRFYMAGAVASLALLTVVAALVAGVLRRQIAHPLLRLSETALTISERRDYGVRAPNFREEEFQQLSIAFNHMLEELGKANTELEAFTFSVSHDLRTPLRAISSYSHLLLEDAESEALSPDAKDNLSRIEINAVRMGQLIDDLLAFSKLDATGLTAVTIQLDGLVEEIWGNLKPEFNGREIDLKIEPLGVVTADPALLRQVFTNLLANAAKYTRPKKRAEIRVGKRPTLDSSDVFFVKDNGVGFDMQFASKLFTAFQRLHRQKDFEGTGVGLAIVKRIIERHGGKVWAEGSPDAGATFFFSLPNDRRT